MSENATINPFNVSRDELLNLAAQKLVDQLGDTEELWNQAERLVSSKVSEVVGKGLKERVDAKLNEEMEKILTTVITPMTIWGESAGNPTSIRELLSERARVFWEVNVDSEGKPSSWGGEPRYKRLMSELLNTAFKEAVKTNADVIVSEFKKAMLQHAHNLVAENINRLIK